MKRWLTMVLVLVGALALATTGVTVAQETTSLHKHNGGRNQATTTQPSSSSPSQVPELTNNSKRGSSTPTALPQSMQSGVQQSAQSAQPASSSGPVYGPYSHSYADTSTIYRGFAATSYGFVYPQPSNTNFYLDLYYYDPSNGTVTYEESLFPKTYLDSISGNPIEYYDQDAYNISPTAFPSGTYIIFADNCVNALKPTNGCVENYSVVNVS